MTSPGFGGTFAELAGTVAGLLLAAPAGAQAVITQSAGSPWQFSATLYVFVPTFDATSSFPLSGSDEDLVLNTHSILDHLKMAFMGTFDAHHDQWGFFVDTLYANIGEGKTKYHNGTIGGGMLPVTASADVNFDLKAWLVTAAGEYRFASAQDRDFDYLFGVRYLDITTRFNYSFTGSIGNLPPAARSGASETSDHNLDGIVGIKGQFRFGSDYSWTVPLYFDIGTGASRLTWQGAGGVGYRFHWGEVLGLYRIIYYDLGGSRIMDLTIRGPMIGATVRW
jgi:hypothetical protein